MAYAEKVPSPSGAYWRGRYRDPHGRYLTVRDDQGQAIRFPAKRAAKKAADGKEADVRAGRWRDPDAGLILFAEWASEWYAGLDLAPSTMANYRRHLEEHLLPFFAAMTLAGISAAVIGKWERSERAAGYSPESIRTWRATLHACLEDATGEHIGANPATRKRGKGKRAGRGKAAGRGPEKAVTDPLGALLIGERMSVLTGRDDELVMILVMFWDALRLGEVTGLGRRYVRPRGLRVEWQITGVEGELLRCPPKDESYGDLDHPPFLSALLAGQAARVPADPCPCHGEAHVFRGFGAPARHGDVTRRVVAAAAGTSVSAVAAVLSGRERGGTRVGAQTRARVEQAIRDTGYRKGSAAGQPAWHWRRGSLEAMFTAAASGWFPPHAPLPRRPVPLAADGTRLHGPGAQQRAGLCWLPVAPGLTPHGLRHSAKSWMEESGIPEVLSEQRLRHEIPGISGTYRHVTPAMREHLAGTMTAAWEAALDARAGMSPDSPVAALGSILKQRAEGRRPRLVPRDSPEEGSAVLPFPAGTTSDLRIDGRG